MALLRGVPVLGRIIEIGYTMVVIIILSAIVGLILAFPVMWLWNYVFTFYRISVFQAWALNVLCGILLGKTSDGSKK